MEVLLFYLPLSVVLAPKTLLLYASMRLPPDISHFLLQFSLLHLLHPHKSHIPHLTLVSIPLWHCSKSFESFHSLSNHSSSRHTYILILLFLPQQLDLYQLSLQLSQTNLSQTPLLHNSIF